MNRSVRTRKRAVAPSARRAGVLGLACLLSVAVAGAVAAQQVGRIQYETYTIPNGLTVILSEEHSTPVVAVDVWYHVGSASERVRRSGFAHLFEHMMFQGSANVRKSEHVQLVQRAGGSMNGSTNEDRTNYFETLPSNRLNLGLWLEADRMRSLAITHGNFENQRSTVQEERRLGVDNQPYAKGFLAAQTAPFDSAGCFAYAHTVIGDMTDLESALVEDVQAFFNQYYTPNNAVLTVAGDFDPAEARRLIQQYYGDLPRAADPPPVRCEVRYGAGARRMEVADSNANLPAVALAYAVPASSHADGPALEMLSSILGNGESSRLNRRLVREERAAMQAAAAADLRRVAGVMFLFALPNQGVDVSRIERLLVEESDRLRNDSIPLAELRKAQNQYRAATVRQRQTAMGVAEALQGALWYDGSLDAVNQDVQRRLAVTPEDLRRVAQRYLTPENRLTVVINPVARGGN